MYFDHSERFTNTSYEDRTSRSVLSLVLMNLIRRLDVRLKAEQSVSTYTRYVRRRVEGEIGYRFYAFTFSMKYLRETYGSYLRDRVSFEVRRPIDVSFR